VKFVETVLAYDQSPDSIYSSTTMRWLLKRDPENKFSFFLEELFKEMED
jgi:hypothetical protein